MQIRAVDVPTALLLTVSGARFPTGSVMTFVVDRLAIPFGKRSQRADIHWLPWRYHDVFVTGKAAIAYHQSRCARH
jgi:hypothetical protein